nr:MAG TPA: hypothetical protein [Caudoviricetes sp.]
MTRYKQITESEGVYKSCKYGHYSVLGTSWERSFFINKTTLFINVI